MNGDLICPSVCHTNIIMKHTRSSYKLAIYYVDIGLSFDASSDVYGGEDLALAAGGGRARRTGRYT